MRYRIKPKQDWPVAYGTRGFYENGRRVTTGFVLLYDEGEYRGANACPGAGWFKTVALALLGAECLEAVGGEKNSDAFHMLFSARLAELRQFEAAA